MTWWERGKYDEVFQKSMNVTMILGWCGCVLHNETQLPPFFEKWKAHPRMTQAWVYSSATCSSAHPYHKQQMAENIPMRIERMSQTRTYTPTAHNVSPKKTLMIPRSISHCWRLTRWFMPECTPVQVPTPFFQKGLNVADLLMSHHPQVSVEASNSSSRLDAKVRTHNDYDVHLMA